MRPIIIDFHDRLRALGAGALDFRTIEDTPLSHARHRVCVEKSFVKRGGEVLFRAQFTYWFTEIDGQAKIEMIDCPDLSALGPVARAVAERMI